MSVSIFNDRDFDATSNSHSDSAAGERDVGGGFLEHSGEAGQYTAIPSDSPGQGQPARSVHRSSSNPSQLFIDYLRSAPPYPYNTNRSLRSLSSPPAQGQSTSSTAATTTYTSLAQTTTPETRPPRRRRAPATIPRATFPEIRVRPRPLSHDRRLGLGRGSMGGHARRARKDPNNI